MSGTRAHDAAQSSTGDARARAVHGTCVVPHTFCGYKVLSPDLGAGWAEGEGAGSIKVLSDMQRAAGGHGCGRAAGCMTGPPPRSSPSALAPRVAFSCMKVSSTDAQTLQALPCSPCPANLSGMNLSERTPQKHRGRRALPPSSPQTLENPRLQARTRGTPSVRLQGCLRPGTGDTSCSASDHTRVNREALSDPQDLGTVKDKQGMQVDAGVVQERSLAGNTKLSCRYSCICANLFTDQLTPTSAQPTWKRVIPQDSLKT